MCQPKRKAEPLTGFWNKKNAVANKLKQAKRGYFRSLNVSNPKAFWKATKFIMKKESRIPFLKSSNNEIISNDGEKASMLNNFFSQCFNSSLLSLSEDDCSTFVDTDISESNEELFSTVEVLEMLCTLDTSKATKLDGISAAMLKATAESITKRIIALFNIQSGKVPKD